MKIRDIINKVDKSKQFEDCVIQMRELSDKFRVTLKVYRNHIG